MTLKDSIIAKAVHSWMLLGLALIGCATVQAATVSCSAGSSEKRVSLVELYTSEGCSSCPPADRWLSGLRQGGLSFTAPLAFHVDYWDRLGWIDRFAQPAFVQRQYALARRQVSDLVYTPQFFRDGVVWRPDRAARPTPAETPPEADLQLHLALSGLRLTVTGEARLRQPGARAELYLALHENRLGSQVAAGENAGNLLRHDFVVRALRGPLPTRGAKASQTFVLEPGWKRADLGVTAFVQDVASGRVLQALQLPLCQG
jgi:hypothetical protein